MPLRFIIVGLVVAGLAGCSTTKMSQIDFLESRIGQLERQIKDQDSEIGALEREADYLKKELDVRNAEVVRLKKSLAPVAEEKKTGIIRVDASTQDIQRALKNAGYYDGVVDGKIGEKTKNAIIEFQKAKGIKVDGIVGKETWAQLSESLGK